MAVTKGKASTSFNLTALGRDILKSLASAQDLSQARVLSFLIWSNEAKPNTLPRVSGTKGGHPSVFFGKDRGTTTCVELRIETKQELDQQAKIAGLSRGDYVETLLRDELARIERLA